VHGTCGLGHRPSCAGSSPDARCELKKNYEEHKAAKARLAEAVRSESAANKDVEAAAKKYNESQERLNDFRKHKASFKAASANKAEVEAE